MPKIKINLPRYTIARWRGGRWAFYFQVPERLRPEGWSSGAIRICGEDGEPTSDALIASLAARRWNDRLDAARRGPVGGPLPGTIPAILRDYQHSEKYTRLADVTKRAYDGYAERVMAWSKTNGDLTVRAMTRPEILRWLATMNATPVMRGHVASFLKLLLRHAMDLGELAINPADHLGLKKAKRLTEPHPYTDAEIEALVAAADAAGRPSIGDAFLIICEIAQREGDILSFRKGEHYVDGVFRFSQSKTGRRLEIPATEKLRARLGERQNNSTVLILNERTRQPYNDETFREVFRRIATAAGLPKSARFMHGRHRAVMTLYRLGRTALEIATITGHAPNTVESILVAHYWERDSQVAARVIASLDEHRRRNPKGTKV